MLSESLYEALHMLNIEAVYWFQSISGVDRALQVVALGITGRKEGAWLRQTLASRATAK